MKKAGKSEEYVLNENEIKSLWGACKELKDRILIGLMMFCGLRVGEATHLRLVWIREGKIHIPSSMECNCWECRKRGSWKPKSKQGIRTIPIPGFLKSTLAEFLKYQPGGLSYNRQYGWHRVQRLCQDAKIPRIFPHALRATCATQLSANGFTAVELCYFMGWKRLEMGEHYIRIASARQGVENKIKQLWPDR